MKITDAKHKDTTGIEDKSKHGADEDYAWLVLIMVVTATLIAAPFTSIWLPIIVNGFLLLLMASFVVIYMLRGNGLKKSIRMATRFFLRLLKVADYIRF